MRPRQQLVICDSWAGTANRTVMLKNEFEITSLALSHCGAHLVGVIAKGDPEDMRAWSTEVMVLLPPQRHPQMRL